MKYCMKDLFDFMESGRVVKVTDTGGKSYTGKCWSYSDVQNNEETGIDEPSIEVQDTILYLSEIQKIEYAE